MRLGFQTINFGNQLRQKHWEPLLAYAQALGIQGIEVFQHPDSLPPYPDLLRLAARYKIQILGFSGGTLAERMKYLSEELPADVPRPEQPPYLYIESDTEMDENGNDLVQRAIASGFRLGLHYHHLSKLRSVEAAIQALSNNEKLLWLPDTAHLYVANQNTSNVIATLTNPSLRSKTCAIHIKDWKAIYGRFSHRFARGFCLPGQGQVGIAAIIEQLKSQKGWNPWLIIELDYAGADPLQDMEFSVEWMKGLIKVSPFSAEQVKESQSTLVQAIEFQPSQAIPFPAEELQRIAIRSKSLIPELAAWLQRQTDSEEVLICSIVTSTGKATVRGRASAPDLKGSMLDRDAVKKLAAEVVRTKKPAEAKVALTDQSEVECEAYPLFNPYNPNLVRQVAVFRIDLKLTVLDKRRRLLKDPQFHECLADAIDINLAEQCLQLPAQAIQLANRVETRTDLLRKVSDLLRKGLNCEGVSIFSVVRGNRIECAGTTGIEWHYPAHSSYSFEEGITGTAARDRAYQIYRHDANSPRTQDKTLPPLPLSSEIVPEKHRNIDSILVAAFFDRKDDVAGVVRCRNPLSKDGLVLFFTEDDLALVESVMLAIQPILATLDENEIRSKAFTILSHELSTPIIGIRGQLYQLRRGMEEAAAPHGLTAWESDRLKNIENFLALLTHNLKGYELALQAPEEIPDLNRTQVLFFADIIAPIVNQISFRLEQRGFAPSRISYGREDDWKQIPALYVDQVLFSQVAYNLIENAIKYAHRDPLAFGVRIWAERMGTGLYLYFEDTGIGIPREYKNLIFTRGGRVPQTQRKKIAGHGLGLWIVKNIIERHEGKIELLTFAGEGKTQFRIWLPSSALSIRRSK